MQGPISASTQAIVQVIATTLEGTRAALATAVPFAAGSSAKLVMLVPRIVPRPLDLEEPTESADFFVRRYEQLLEDCGADARVEVCHCRRLHDMLLTMIDRDATIVIGGASGRWLMSPEERLASRLARAAKRVIFVAARPVAASRRTLGPIAAVIVGLTALNGGLTAGWQTTSSPRPTGAGAGRAAVDEARPCSMC